MTELEAYGVEIGCPGLTLTELIAAHRFYRGRLREYGERLGIQELSLGDLMDLYLTTKNCYEQTQVLLLDTLKDLKEFQAVLRKLLESNATKSLIADMLKDGLQHFPISDKVGLPPTKDTQ